MHWRRRSTSQALWNICWVGLLCPRQGKLSWWVCSDGKEDEQQVWETENSNQRWHQEHIVSLVGRRNPEWKFNKLLNTWAKHVVYLILLRNFASQVTRPKQTINVFAHLNSSNQFKMYFLNLSEWQHASFGFCTSRLSMWCVSVLHCFQWCWHRCFIAVEGKSARGNYCLSLNLSIAIGK